MVRLVRATVYNLLNGKIVFAKKSVKRKKSAKDKFKTGTELVKILTPVELISKIVATALVTLLRVNFVEIDQLNHRLYHLQRQ